MSEKERSSIFQTQMTVADTISIQILKPIEISEFMDIEDDTKTKKTLTKKKKEKK